MEEKASESLHELDLTCIAEVHLPGLRAFKQKIHITSQLLTPFNNSDTFSDPAPKQLLTCTNVPHRSQPTQQIPSPQQTTCSIEPEATGSMAKGTVDWNATETWQRVVAAIFATGVKVCATKCSRYPTLLTKMQIDTKQVALCFGTTYVSLPATSVDTIDFRQLWMYLVTRRASLIFPPFIGHDRESFPQDQEGRSRPSVRGRERRACRVAWTYFHQVYPKQHSAQAQFTENSCSRQ